MRKSFLLFTVFLSLVFLFSACKKNSNTNATSKGTCSDGVLNQDETAIDCGGKCSPCATCSDGIQNQGETAIDCGGPCSQCTITYPIFGYYGRNILKNDTINIVTSNGSFPYFYSMMASLPPNASVKVVFKNISSGGFPTYISGTHFGWTFVSWSTSYQEFVVSFPTKADISMVFEGHSSATVEIYENGSTSPTRTKQISW